MVDLLKEYKDIFLSTFSKMKGITGYLKEIKIQLKPNAKPIMKKTYRLNPKYKERLQQELDKMLTIGIIVLVEESQWIIPMVFQEKKIVGIHICVDLYNLNDACFLDPCPTSFRYEILENIGGREMYSFTEEFSSYNQVKITEEEKQNMNFAMEWVSFAYMVIHFGLKNSPIVLSRIIVATFK